MNTSRAGASIAIENIYLLRFGEISSRQRAPPSASRRMRIPCRRVARVIIVARIGCYIDVIAALSTHRRNIFRRAQLFRAAAVTSHEDKSAGRRRFISRGRGKHGVVASAGRSAADFGRCALRCRCRQASVNTTYENGRCRHISFRGGIIEALIFSGACLAPPIHSRLISIVGIGPASSRRDEIRRHAEARGYGGGRMPAAPVSGFSALLVGGVANVVMSLARHRQDDILSGIAHASLHHACLRAFL